jgi:hypothetical protein
METVKELTDAEVIADRVYHKLLSAMQYPVFGIGNVPIPLVAKVLQKDQTWVRAGIEQGWLPIGYCTKGAGKRNFYVSPKMLWEVTGYVWNGEIDL